MCLEFILISENSIQNIERKKKKERRKKKRKEKKRKNPNTVLHKTVHPDQIMP